MHSALDTIPESSKSETDPLGLIGESIRDYVIESYLGGGTFGHVYRGQHRQIGSKVAIKFLKTDHLDPATLKKRARRFEREAKVVSDIEQGVAKSITLEPYRDTLCIIMELVAGRTLREHLNDYRALQPRQALQIACELAATLQRAHGKGIIHRDLKPENIMLEPDGHSGVSAKILDWGIAHCVEPDAESMHTLMPLGTNGYRPRDSDVTAEFDVYSLGVILCETLTGESAPLIADVLTAGASSHDSVQIRALPASIKKLLRQCVNDHAKKRPSMEELLEALHRLMQQRQRRAAIAGSAPLLAVVLVGALILGIGLGRGLRRDGAPPRPSPPPGPSQPPTAPPPAKTATWRQQRFGLPGDDRFLLLSVTGDGRGGLYAVGQTTSDNPKGKFGVVLSSSDQGKRWQPRVLSTTSLLYSVWCDGAERVYAVGARGRIIKSLNRGADWGEASVDTNITLTGLWGDQRGNLVLVGDRQGKAGEPATSHSVILHSTDAGQTWTPRRAGTGNGLRSIWGRDVDHLWAVGWGGALLRGSQGATRWELLPRTGARDRDRLHAIWGATSGVLIVVGATELVSNPTVAGVVLLSSDEGRTWRRAERSAPYLSVSGSGDRSVYLVGGKRAGSPNLLHSSDGGGTWMESAGSEVLARSSLRSIWVHSPQRAVAVGDRGALFQLSAED